ncbi:fluoride efflux transporter CrcB [bacterium]|nr:fluoride efflux transporter CrcB [bacterium]
MLNNLIAIFVGGGTGAILRYLTTYLCKSVFGLSFIGTISVNMIGCLLIGFIFGIASQKTEMLPQTVKLLIVVGFLGGLTTFSTFSLESFEFIKDGKIVIGLAYILFSCLIGVTLTALGVYLSKFI